MKISFVIPVYNKKQYLRQCVESIINQTCCDMQMEVLLVDDGSNDGSGALCDDLAAKHPMIHVIHQRNRGVSAARNAGMEHAEGEWIAFVDADDWIADDFVNTFLPYLRENVDICFGEEVLVQGPVDKRWYEEKEMGKEIGRKEFRAYERGLLNKYSFHGNIRLTSSCEKLFRRAFVEAHQLRFPEGLAKCEDALFNLYAFYYAEKGIYCRHPIYHYRHVEDSASHRYYENTIAEYNRHLELVEAFIRATDRWEELQEDYRVRVVFHFLYCVMTDYCHADNPYSYQDRKKAFLQGVESSPFQEAFQKVSARSFTFRERVLFFCVKHRLFWIITVLSHVNRIYEKRKK